MSIEDYERQETKDALKVIGIIIGFLFLMMFVGPWLFELGSYNADKAKLFFENLR